MGMHTLKENYLLVVFGYLDQGGKGIIQASLDTGAFDRFILADGMIGSALTDDLGKGINGAFGTMPGGESEAAKKWAKVATASGIPLDGPFRDGSYDAAALIILAAQAGNSADRASIQKHIMAVAPYDEIIPKQVQDAGIMVGITTLRFAIELFSRVIVSESNV